MSNSLKYRTNIYNRVYITCYLKLMQGCQVYFFNRVSEIQQKTHTEGRNLVLDVTNKTVADPLGINSVICLTAVYRCSLEQSKCMK